MKKPTLGIIGAGVMGSAIAKAVDVMGRKSSVSKIVVSDPDPEKLRNVSSGNKIKTTTNNEELVKLCDVIIIAVKPFAVESVLREIKGAVKNKHLVCSIAAGIPLKKFSRYLKTPRLARAMPNTPALIRNGFTGLFASKGCKPADVKLLLALFTSFSEAITVKSEKAIDAITALSGSGPGYVFYFLEAFEKAAKSLGFPPDDSKKIALYTLYGASELAYFEDEDFVALRKKVTTPEGTTEAGIKILQSKKWDKIFIQACKAAFRRAQKLGK